MVRFDYRGDIKDYYGFQGIMAVHMHAITCMPGWSYASSYVMYLPFEVIFEGEVKKVIPIRPSWN